MAEPNTDTDSLEPAQTAHVPTKATFRWRILRVLAILLYVLGSAGLITTISMCIFSSDNNRGRVPMGALLFGIAVYSVLTLGFLFLARWSASKVCSAGVVTNNLSGRNIAIVIIGAICAVAAPILGLPEFVSGIGFLCAFFGTLYVVIACKRFLWGVFILAGVVPGLVCLPILLPSLARSRMLVETHRRTEVFAQVLPEVTKLFSQADLREAVQHSESLKPVPDLTGGILIFDASSSQVSEIDALIPMELSAQNPQSLKVVVIMGEIGGDEYGRLIAPVMVYGWPTKELLAKHKLETVLSIRPQSPSRSSVYSAAANALVRMLESNVKSHP